MTRDLLVPAPTMSSIPDSPNPEVLLVSPMQPTIAGDHKTFPLLGGDIIGLFLPPLKVLFIVPDIIDVDRFVDALSKTLSLFPTFSGRLRRGSEDASWSIALENAPIPIHIEREASTPLPDDDWVIKESIDGFIEPLKMKYLVNSDEPMIKLKLSFYPETRRTAIGINVSHILADGYYMTQFELALSEHYQLRIAIAERAFRLPKHLPIPAATNTSIGPPREIQVITSAVDDIFTDRLESIKNTSQINIRISTYQSSQLKQHVITELGPRLPEGMYFSTNDVLAALLVSIINRLDPGHIVQISLVIDYRSHIDPDYYGGNAIGTAMTKDLSLLEQTDMPSIALAIREAIVKEFNPDVVCAKVTQRAVGIVMVNAGIMPPSAMPPRGRALFNCCSSFDRPVDFGYAHQVRFHTDFTGNRFYRTFHSNPLVVDGDVVDARTGSLDLQFRVDDNIYDRVQQTLTDELEQLVRIPAKL